MMLAKNEFGFPSGAVVLCRSCRASEEKTVDHILEFIAEFEIETLNVAGPRASNEERAYPFTKSVVTKFLQKI